MREKAAMIRAFCLEWTCFLRVESMGDPPCQRDFYYIIEIFGKVCILFGPMGGVGVRIVCPGWWDLPN